MKRAINACLPVYVITIGLSLWATGPLATAQSATYYDSFGKISGSVESRTSRHAYYAPDGTSVMSARSWRRDDTTFYSSSGRIVGKQSELGSSQVSFKDSSGFIIGSARRTIDGYTYYDKTGRTIGREVRAGSAAYFYDSSGRLVESASIRSPSSSSASSSAKSDSWTKTRKSDSSATGNLAPAFSKRLFEPLARQKK